MNFKLKVVVFYMFIYLYFHLGALYSFRYI